ncbi:hypothetical protein [Escherichia coli]|uniref:hypothetical protein n=1 Tax=Escherichia coli TaxID=562 RepID=UPI00201A2DD9|nr:hypothetical protein [Escherichia coli]
MDLLNKHIASILRAKDEESLAIFVGAGVSKSSETKTIKMPSWGDLIDTLISDLNIKDESDYLKIAQLYYWICPYISRHLLSLNPLLACCRRYSRGER